MSEQQAISTGLEVLKLIVTGGIGAAIIGIIGKVVVDSLLEKRPSGVAEQGYPMLYGMSVETNL